MTVILTLKKLNYLSVKILIRNYFLLYYKIQFYEMQGGSGSASNIKFQNIEMDNVANPIIIDQNYCDKKKKPCKKSVN